MFAIHWSFQGQIVQHSPKTGVIVSSSDLALQSVQIDQAGNYTCIASNVEGDGESNIVELKVMCKWIQNKRLIQFSAFLTITISTKRIPPKTISQIVRYAVQSKNGFTVSDVTKRYAFYAKSMHIRRPNHSNGHSTIQPKRLICHKMDLKSIPRAHRSCSTHRSRWVSTKINRKHKVHPIRRFVRPKRHARGQRTDHLLVDCIEKHLIIIIGSSQSAYNVFMFHWLIGIRNGWGNRMITFGLNVTASTGVCSLMTLCTIPLLNGIQRNYFHRHANNIFLSRHMLISLAH